MKKLFLNMHLSYFFFARKQKNHKMNQDSILNQFLKPLKTFEEVFILLYLNSAINFNLEIDFACETFNSIFQTEYDIQTIKLAVSKFSFLIKISQTLKLLKEKLEAHSEIIPIQYENCMKCSKKLFPLAENPSVTYCFNGCFRKRFSSAECNTCKIKYTADYYEHNGLKFLYKENSDLKYLITSNQTAFEVRLLQWLDANIVRNTTSFAGFSDAFNEVFAKKDVRLN
jgi:hypothetical protein